jgi:hypothetical protein
MNEIKREEKELEELKEDEQAETFQNGRYPYLRRSYLAERLVGSLLQGSLQPCSNPSSMRDLLGIMYKSICFTYHGIHFGLNDVPRVFTKIMKQW